jgi:hypothetical protein
MPDPAVTETVIEQGKALVRAIEVKDYVAVGRHAVQQPRDEADRSL